jgi:DNA-binding HxlR family transcriptional regulator
MKRRKTVHIKDCAGRSTCPLTNTLDLIGDKWTLLVIRDMLFVGKKQFGDFLESPEGISTNILTDRLKRLEESGIIEKRPYQKKPVRYEYFLTDAGRALEPVLIAIVGWGYAHIEGTKGPSEKELEELRRHYS